MTRPACSGQARRAAVRELYGQRARREHSHVRTLHGLALLAVAAWLAGCEFTPEACGQIACAPCPPFATVLVTDAETGLPVDGTAVTGGTATWTCSELEGKTHCTSLQLTGTGSFDVEVTAPGYAAATAHVATAEQQSGNCCPACLVYPAVSVQIAPL